MAAQILQHPRSAVTDFTPRTRDTQAPLAAQRIEQALVDHLALTPFDAQYRAQSCVRMEDARTVQAAEWCCAEQMFQRLSGSSQTLAEQPLTIRYRYWTIALQVLAAVHAIYEGSAGPTYISDLRRDARQFQTELRARQTTPTESGEAS